MNPGRTLLALESNIANLPLYQYLAIINYTPHILQPSYNTHHSIILLRNKKYFPSDIKTFNIPPNHPKQY